mmetsp:Transcript_8579/g.16574  ORF Transcript_8579/g.16574 Transcript_8579/m.16574 type:complete len:208 (-) Transcript_8579:117-740(-)
MGLHETGDGIRPVVLLLQRLRLQPDRIRPATRTNPGGLHTPGRRHVSAGCLQRTVPRDGLFAGRGRRPQAPGADGHCRTPVFRRRLPQAARHDAPLRRGGRNPPAQHRKQRLWPVVPSLQPNGAPGHWGRSTIGNADGHVSATKCAPGRILQRCHAPLGGGRRTPRRRRRRGCRRCRLVTNTQHKGVVTVCHLLTHSLIHPSIQSPT